jgi:hypothetical protein
MKLDDPEALERPRVVDSRLPSTYRFLSQSCRQFRHQACSLTSCECECHADDSEVVRLRETLARDIKCSMEECTFKVVNNSLFCYQCSRGNTPKMRAAAASNHIRDSRPL